MKKTFFLILCLVLLHSNLSNAQSGNIVDEIANSENHLTLVEALRAGKLIETLNSKDTFTVLAPTNKAFDGLQKGVLETLLKEEHAGKLRELLMYHVIAGLLDLEELHSTIKDTGREMELKTAGGKKLIAFIEGNEVKIKDANGNMATLKETEMKAKNGFIYSIDAVMLP